MNEALKIAIEKGGYDSDVHWATNLPEYAKSQFIVDPDFWKAIAKAKGFTYGLDTGQWAIFAHDYLDVVLTNGDTKEFWKDLLK